MEYHDHVLDYLKWRGNIAISEDGFNEIDAMICAELSYLNLDGLVPGVGEKSNVTISDVYDIYQKRINDNEPVDLQAHEVIFLLALGPTRRFGSIVLSDYLHVTDMSQPVLFGSVCLRISPSLYYISFRGTDNDILGWKETFSMIYQMPIPSQKLAVDYLNRVVKGCFRKYYVGGHSKGGNLAKYAAAFCKAGIQRKIPAIYCFDAPGFNQDMMQYEGFARIVDRIRAYIPQGSVVGTTLEHAENLIMVHSQGEGIGQHDLLSWSMNAEGFLRYNQREPGSLQAQESIANWIAHLSFEERERFLDLFFDVVVKAGVTTFPELMDMKLMTVLAILKEMKNVSAEKKEFVFHVFKLLVQERGKAKKVKNVTD